MKDLIEMQKENEEWLELISKSRDYFDEMRKKNEEKNDQPVEPNDLA